MMGNGELDESWVDYFRESFPGWELPREEQEKFRGLLTALSLEKGEHLVREGDAPRQIAFAVSGLFRAYYLTEAGKEKTIVFRDRGKILSAYSSFLKGEPARFSIQALEKSLVLSVPIGDFEKLRSGHSAWTILTGRYFLDLFLEKENRERALLSDDAETRYRRFLEEYPGFFDRISHYHIASYLDISNVTLSRIRNGRYHPCQRSG